MNGLSAYLSSSYFQAANALGGRNGARQIVAYVESYDDVCFWRSILSVVENDKLKFYVTLPAQGNKLKRGKNAALFSALMRNVGKDMIACVDADYDYLKQGSDELSDKVCNNPYVFHTYAYAIENLQSWAPALHDVCVQCTLNDAKQKIDFEEFLTAYSEIIFPLFVWTVLGQRKPKLCFIDQAGFTSLIKIPRPVNFNSLERVRVKMRLRLKLIEDEASKEAVEENT